MYQRWRHHSVRDLAWCCLSPSLLGDYPLGTASAYRLSSPTSVSAWLDQLDLDPQALQAHISGLTSTRLGVYFESLWAFYWRHSPRIKLQAHNLQVHQQSGKMPQTLGAFDFLISERSGTETVYFHIECAVKFYLGHDPQKTEWANWIGPSANDRLDKKLVHMQTHQLRLATYPEAQQLAQAKGIDLEQYQPRHLLRGYFFAPWKTPDLRPQHTPENVGAGLWCHRQELSEFLRKTANNVKLERYKVLPRLEWMSPLIAGKDDKHLYTAEQLKENLSSERAHLIARLTPLDSNRWYETARFFSVPPGWPENY